MCLSLVLDWYGHEFYRVCLCERDSVCVSVCVCARERKSTVEAEGRAEGGRGAEGARRVGDVQLVHAYRQITPFMNQVPYEWRPFSMGVDLRNAQFASSAEGARRVGDVQFVHASRQIALFLSQLWAEISPHSSGS